MLSDPGTFVIGRSSEADWAIPDQSVSRRHASLTHRDGVWYLADLESRHGTSINGKKLDPGRPVAIEHGDQIGFGVWMCRCQSGSRRPGVTTPFADLGGGLASISAIDTTRLSGVAQHGLEALLALTHKLDQVRLESEIAEAVVEAVAVATGCQRVVVTRPVSGDEFETLAANTPEPAVLSQSLIEAASREGLVELRVAGTQAMQAHSIMELSIRSAICTPIKSGDTPAAFLTLDTRDSERVLPSDAAAFCQSVAQLAGMALERVQAAELAARHAQLQDDLSAARRAQELLSPKSTGKIGRVSYVFESHPGRVVAGDLFDIFALDDTRTAFFLGDVSGKGVGAAVLMAAAQSQLRTCLLSGQALADAIAAVNFDLFNRTDPSKFVTLIAGVIDTGCGSLEIVDAGHGLCILAPTAGAPTRLEAPNGYPLGVAGDGEYEAHSVRFTDGCRVVVFSDGAVEQANADSKQFGFDAVIRSVTRGGEPADITNAIVEDVRAHACGELADDLTVATIRIE